MTGIAANEPNFPLVVPTFVARPNARNLNSRGGIEVSRINRDFDGPSFQEDERRGGCVTS